MKKKGFTLVELLVVIAIIAMLLAILMPALAKVKTLAYQMLCGTNLKGVANALLVYGQDNNEKYPVAGVGTVEWNRSGLHPAGTLPTGWNWDDPAKPPSTVNVGTRPTVSACLYLLVKYADVSPSSFVCKAGKQRKLNVAASQLNTEERSAISTNTAAPLPAKDPTECWDFSKVPARYCSYSYAYPWDTRYLLSSASKSGMAVAADLNPWISGEISPTWQTAATPSNTATPTPGYDAPQLITAASAGKNTWVSGNSNAHETTGQNVLFNDMHVEFAKQPHPDSAIQNDNIYTIWDSSIAATAPGRRGRGCNGITGGTGPSDIAKGPAGKEDSYLVQW
jgi:prepilin-type N-terminal cleavage/methylation domain-containing protein